MNVQRHCEFIVSIADEFEMAYIATGLTAVRRTFGDGRNNGCMVTAMAKQLGCNTGAVGDRVDAMLDVVCGHLRAKYKTFDEGWWHCFVGYCMAGFDGLATYPRQWMERNRETSLSAQDSPKLMGAAVAGLVYRHVTKPAPVESAPVRAAALEDTYELAMVGDGTPAW